MYRCNRCAQEFGLSHMAVWPETVARPERGYAMREMMTGCPRCHYTELTELFPCGLCGEYVRRRELDEGLCPDCRARARRSVVEWYDRQDAPIRRWFDGHYDGE